MSDQQMARLLAPWSREQVTALNRWQCEACVHPFTCGNCSGVSLVATARGWICVYCDYTQGWAWEAMFNDPPAFPTEFLASQPKPPNPAVEWLEQVRLKVSAGTPIEPTLDITGKIVTFSNPHYPVAHAIRLDDLIGLLVDQFDGQHG